MNLPEIQMELMAVIVLILLMSPTGNINPLEKIAHNNESENLSNTINYAPVSISSGFAKFKGKLYPLEKYSELVKAISSQGFTDVSISMDESTNYLYLKSFMTEARDENLIISL